MFVATNDQNYKDIASSIRSQNGTSTTYKPNEMANAINSLESVTTFTTLNLTHDLDNTSGSLPATTQLTMTATWSTKTRYLCFVVDYCYNSSNGLKTAYAIVVVDKNMNTKSTRIDGITINSITKSGSTVTCTYSLASPASGYTGKVTDSTITMRK